jgi:chloramphenicol 3-O-phosphotransferase
MTEQRLYLITGAMAAGKSTVAEALARRFERAVHLRGDVFRRMIVSGQAEMEAVLSAEALEQLHLRQAIAGLAARSYLEAGFTVVYQDIIVGDDLVRVTTELADLHPCVVLLDPSAEVLARRDRERHKHGYSDAFPPRVLRDALRATAGIGLAIDSSDMGVDEVVQRILAEWP